MKVDYRLNKEDIEKIIAEAFKVDRKHVYVHPYMGITGYGVDEKEEPDIEIIVSTDGPLSFEKDKEND